MKTILLATDLSPRAHHALKRAVELAAAHETHLDIVHVVDEDLPGDIVDQHRRLAEETIRDRLGMIPDASSIALTINIACGRVGAQILDLAKSVGAELLVLGTHRKEPFADFFRGTTAERLIRVCALPVLVAAAPVRRPYKRVMIGFDFSICSRRAIECAVALLPEADFFLVHAYDVPFRGFLYGRDSADEVAEDHERRCTAMINDEMMAIERATQVVSPLFKRIVKMGRPQEVIRAEFERLKPDLIVVGTHGRTGVAHALLGSVAEDLLADPLCDVLAVKAW